VRFREEDSVVALAEAMKRATKSGAMVVFMVRLLFGKWRKKIWNVFYAMLRLSMVRFYRCFRGFCEYRLFCLILKKSELQKSTKESHEGIGRDL
jgi:uncharacterized membrane protein